eukprot:12884668-Prorocentrum_lima.AAC.1
MVVCDHLVPDNEWACYSTSTQHDDIELLKMVLSLTNGRLGTITMTYMNPVLQDTPADENKDAPIEAPQIL